MHEHRVTAEDIIGASLARWCKQSFPGLPFSEIPAPLNLQHATAVIDFINFIQVYELQEATYWFTSAYAHLVGDQHRKDLAMFFTPPSLTKRLLDDLAASGVDFANRSFCDPACGGAAFLTPIAMRMRSLLLAKGVTPEEVLKHVQAHLYGIDRDKTLCKLSQHFLLMTLHEEVTATGLIPQFQVLQGDSLLHSTQLVDALDVVVCNPPFRKMKAQEVQVYFSEFSDIIEGQPNLYSLFVVLCVRLLSQGGICALVTPTSFLSGQYFSKLRTFLLAQSQLLSIGMVSDRQGVFMDVEQETALTLVKRKDNEHSRPSVTDVCVVSPDGEYVYVGQCSLPSSGSAWPIPRTESDIPLLRSAAKSGVTLAEYGYSIRIGAFVWNRDHRPTYVSAKCAARAKGESAIPLIWSSDIAGDGSLRFNGYPKDNMEPCFVNLGSKSHRSIVKNPSVILQRVTSNDQSRRLIAANVPDEIFNTYGGFVGENHIVIIEQVVPMPVLPPAQLTQLLGTPTVDRCFRCISGATNVSAFELKQLRLPNPSRLKKYLTEGHNIAEAAKRALET
ncbi:MAG: N-6 DNA methylase [Halieaceae bacterium]|nr:N-6 DNA methylase [Halieaceae bacterium]